jgi:polysaccharide deacetylase 2 family uncharacterized protein YibQ
VGIERSKAVDEGEYKVDIEAVQHRRNRRLMWKKVRYVGILSLLAVLVLAFLFSPWGPWRRAFYGPEETQEAVGENRAEGEQAEEVSEAGEEESHNEVQEETGGKLEKASDPTPPTVAIVVDDTGLDTKNLERWLAIDAPITFAVMPYCVASRELSERLYGAGFRIMLHIPTENDPPNSFSGQGQLAVGMSYNTVFSTLDGDLATVPHVTGINNHQGGRGCNDLQLMTYECEWAQERGLYVVDSDSSTHSQVTAAATNLGFPRRANQVFIDHENEPGYIRSRMRQLANIARQEGTAIGICHFHRPNTPSIVGEMIRTLREEGIHFAFVQDIHN